MIAHMDTPTELTELCATLYGPAVDADAMWEEITKRAIPFPKDIKNLATKVRQMWHPPAPAAPAPGTRQAAKVQRAATADANRLQSQGVKANAAGRDVGTMLSTKSGKTATGVIAGTGALRATGASRSSGGIDYVPDAYAYGKRDVSKLSPGSSDVHSQRSANVRRNVERGSNAVGIAAGSLGLAAAARDDRLKDGGRIARRMHATGQKMPSIVGRIKSKKIQAGLAGAAVVTQLANLGGDGLIAGTLKEKKPVAKAARDVEFRGEFTKFDDDKRQAFGWASIVSKDGELVIDRQGDYISIEDLEEAAYSYVHKSRVGGDMHRRDGESAHKVSDMIESIVFTPEKIAKMGLPEDFPQGWWVGYQVHDEDTWDLVRKQGRTGFSIHGRGIRRDVDVDELMGAR